MASWLYEARDGRGHTVRGSHEASSREEALHFLRAQGLFLTRLEAAKRGVSVPGSTASQDPPLKKSPSKVAGQPSADPRVPAQVPPKTTTTTAQTPLAEMPLVRASKRDLSLFFRQLESATHAGVSLGAALATLEKHAEVASLRRVAELLGTRAQRGEPLSVGMRAFPSLFSPLMLGIVRAGEKGGTLETAFGRLADYAERDYELETAIKRETIYPKILIFASIFIPAVVPLVLSGPAAALRQALPPLIFVAVVFFLWRFFKFWGRLGLRKSGLGKILDEIKLVIPVVGKVTRGLASAKFCRALGALYAGGVPPVESLQISAAACGNMVLETRALAQLPDLMNGTPLSQILAKTGAFHPIALQMLKVGEDTGDVDGQLDKAATFLETDAETAIRQAVPIMGVLIFLAVAAYIGYIVVTSWTSGPYTQMEGLIE